MVSTVATQSRSASLIASFSVALPAGDGHDLGAEQLHAEHVERLALDVDRAHVHDAVEPEQRRRGGGGDAVLAGAGLGDHALLAHAPGEQRLAEHVVDLVRAGVGEVLALQQHPHAEPLGQPVALGDRRRAARRTSAAARRTRSRNSSETHAVRNSASSSSSAGTSVSGTKRPPNSPNRPRPTGSGPGGSRRTGSPAGRGHRGHPGQSVRRVDVRAVGHPVVRRRLGVGRPAVAPPSCVARRPRRLDEASQLAGVLATGAGRGLDAGRHVDAPRPHAPDRLRRRCRRSARRRAAGAPRAGTASASAQSNAVPEPGSLASTSTMSTGPLPTAASAGSPAPKAWITNGTRWRIQRTSDSGSRPWSCAPPRPSVLTSSTTRSLVSSRNTPTVMTPGGQAVEDLADRLRGDLARAARREHEAERVGTERDGEQGVLLVGDAADLDPHRARGYRTPPKHPRTFAA